MLEKYLHYTAKNQFSINDAYLKAFIFYYLIYFYTPLTIPLLVCPPTVPHPILPPPDLCVQEDIS